MSLGASGGQVILTSQGWRSLKSLYDEYVSKGINIGIAYVEPIAFRTVKYMTINQVFNHSVQNGIKLTAEADVDGNPGAEASVTIDGFILDLAEDYPPRPTVRHPSDAKCLVGPNMDTTSKYLVRKILTREFVTINCYSLPVPNMIGKGGFVIID